MSPALRPRTAILFIGDLFFFVFALWATLFLRAFEVPSQELFLQHLAPFSLLFFIWAGVYFIAGLYESRSIILARRALSQTLLVAQGINVGIAALFFFFVSAFGISPKTVLFIYLGVSFLLILLWRAFIFPRATQRTDTALVIGRGEETHELTKALRHAHRAPVSIAAHLQPEGDLPHAVKKAIEEHRPRFIIADFNDLQIAALFSEFYNYLSRGVRFLDATTLYEEVFGRVPLSIIDNRWLARNASRYAHTLYDPVKRLMDIVLGAVGGTLSLFLYPFVALAIYIEDGTPVFIAQERVGEEGRIVRMYKFRSMTGNDEGKYESGGTKLRVTRVGGVLRRTRLDELPQLWSVVRGDLSLIGPRPEFPTLVELYEKEIPHYGVRHLIKPGLSGWAQLYHDNHPHHGAEVEATREKFSYDLYYLKHRSLMLDAVIALKTLKKLLTRSGV